MIALTFFSIGFSINIVGNIRRFNFLDQPPPSWEKVIGKNLKLPTYAERLTPVFLRGYDTNVGAIYVFICGEQYLNFLLSCTNLQNKPVPNVRLTRWNELKDILFELCPDEKMEEIKLKHPSWLALMDAGKDKPYYTFSIDYIPTDDSIKAVKPFSSVIKSDDFGALPHPADPMSNKSARKPASGRIFFLFITATCPFSFFILPCAVVLALPAAPYGRGHWC